MIASGPQEAGESERSVTDAHRYDCFLFRGRGRESPARVDELSSDHQEVGDATCPRSPSGICLDRERRLNQFIKLQAETGAEMIPFRPLDSSRCWEPGPSDSGRSLQGASRMVRRKSPQLVDRSSSPG